MDKKGASVSNSLDSIRQDLGLTPLLTQTNIGLEQDFEGEDLIQLAIVYVLVLLANEN